MSDLAAADCVVVVVVSITLPPSPDPSIKRLRGPMTWLEAVENADSPFD